MTDIPLTEDDRGKRRMARRVALFWGAYSLAAGGGVVFGDLAQHELDSLVALHWAVTLVSGPLIAALHGLDVMQLKRTP